LSDRQTGIVSAIDAVGKAAGNAVSWLTLAMVLVTCVIVLLRYLFEFGVIWLQESLTWMHAVVFMLGAAFTLERDEHVRVDIFYRRMSARQRGMVDLLGVLLFIFPFCGYVVYESFGYVTAAWSVGELSVNSGGLPYPFVPLLKTILLIMPAAVALQGLSLLLSSWQRIREC
jgi:TRAP-type mannitol/chloroaromatic compound transport system permease small subunit